MNTQTSEPGFTLWENLMVLAIIGILSAMVTPSWLSFLTNYRLNVAQEQVYQALRQAQSQAKKEKSTWQASFKQENGIVKWAVHPILVHPDNGVWHSLDSAVQLDRETTLQESHGIRHIQFNDLGAIRKPPLGTITLSMKSGGTAKRCVIVSTILGSLRTAKENTVTKNNAYCY